MKLREQWSAMARGRLCVRIRWTFRTGVLLWSFIFSSCAVPVVPSGGPADQDPPALLSSAPADGAVNQSVDRIEFEFDERIEEASVLRAISVIPEFETPLRIRARGHRITVTFPDALRENTTYIVSLDTRLRDAHGVALKQPLTVAFGTGPSINRGRLRGNVVHAADGRPAAAIDVFAYAVDSTAAASLDRAPDYRIQTDQEGHFSLTYLREQKYFVLAVRDLNGNHTVEPTEWTAIPPIPYLTADSTGTPVERPWVLSRIDFEGPAVIQARARNSREIELRYSEPVVIGDTVTTDWIVADSLTSQAHTVELMYPGATSRDVILRVDSLSAGRYMVAGSAAVSDSTGNTMRPDTLYFSASAAAFVNAPVFEGFAPDSLSTSSSGFYRIWPGTSAGVRFSSPPGEAWNDLVSVEDTLGASFDYHPLTRNGRLITLLDATLERPVRVSVTDGDSTRVHVFIAAPESQLGELGGTLSGAGGFDRIRVELIREGTSDPIVYKARPDDTGKFLFSGLPGASRYRVRAFVDRNDDGRWSPGTAAPYSEPEPIGWMLVEEPVRARWETVMPDSLSIIQ